MVEWITGIARSSQPLINIARTMVQSSLYGETHETVHHVYNATYTAVQRPMAPVSLAPDTYSPGKTSQDYIITIIVA